jgi:membrane peptidoglycan carboxypeptidase
VVSNTAPLLYDDGRAFIGFQAASQKTFGLRAQDVSLTEAALLVAMLERPSGHDPFRHPQAARAARDRILVEYRGTGGDSATLDLALATPIPSAPAVPSARGVNDYLGILRGELAVNVVGERVTTNIDLRLQNATVACFEKQSAFLTRLLHPTKNTTVRVTGVVLDVRSGTLLAAHTHGSTAAANAHARHPAGSALKTLLFAWALSHRARSTDVLPNRPRAFDGGGSWIPRNLHEDAPVELTLGEAFVSSQNVAAVELLVRLGGPAAFFEMAGQAGFDTSAWPAELGLALGQGEVTVLEMARLAATVLGDGHLASGAARAEPTRTGPRVFDPAAVQAMKELMAEVAQRGTAMASRQQARREGYHGPLYAKTGTSDGGADLWVIGGTDHLATAYWIGTANRAPTNATAADVAAPLWGEWIALLERIRQDDG